MLSSLRAQPVKEAFTRCKNLLPTCTERALGSRTSPASRTYDGF